MSLKDSAAAFQEKYAEYNQLLNEIGDAEISTEQKQKLDRLTKEADELHAKVAESKGIEEASNKYKNLNDELSQPQGRPDYANTDPRQVKENRSYGQAFTDSPEFKQWYKQISPSGGIPAKGIKMESPAIEAKALVLSSNTSGGAMVHRDYYPNVELPLRPLTIRDVITVLKTGSNLVEFVRITALNRAAKIVPESTSTTDASGVKPEAGMSMEIEQTAVKTIAVHMPVTRQIFQDVPYLQSLIDAFLNTDLQLALEEEIITGAGGSSHFTGLDNTPGLSAQAFVADTLDSTGGLLTTTRKARTVVRVVGRANPTGYLLNPYDWETIDLARNSTNGIFYFGGPMQMGTKMLWGLPVIESEVVPKGTGYVGDLKQMVLWDREEATTRVTDSHSDWFIRNILDVLTELRAAFGVLRPAAIVDISLLAGKHS